MSKLEFPMLWCAVMILPRPDIQKMILHVAPLNLEEYELFPHLADLGLPIGEPDQPPHTGLNIRLVNVYKGDLAVNELVLLQYCAAEIYAAVVSDKPTQLNFQMTEVEL